MDQKKALEIMDEVCDAYAEILPKPIHDAYLYGDYAEGRYDAESSVNIAISVDMSWEELRSYEKKLIHVDSEMDLKYGVFVYVCVTPLSQFRPSGGSFLYGNLLEDGIRRGASEEEIAAVLKRAQERKERALKPETVMEIFKKVYTDCTKILPRPIHDAYLYGDYATGRYDDESSVDILITVDMSWEELRSYSDQLTRVDSSLSLEYDVMVSTYVTPLENFEKGYGYAIYGDVRKEGIRYVA